MVVECRPVVQLWQANRLISGCHNIVNLRSHKGCRRVPLIHRTGSWAGTPPWPLSCTRIRCPADTHTQNSHLRHNYSLSLLHVQHVSDLKLSSMPVSWDEYERGLTSRWALTLEMDKRSDVRTIWPWHQNELQCCNGARLHKRQHKLYGPLDWGGISQVCVCCVRERRRFLSDIRPVSHTHTLTVLWLAGGCVIDDHPWQSVHCSMQITDTHTHTHTHTHTLYGIANRANRNLSCVCVHSWIWNRRKWVISLLSHILYPCSFFSPYPLISSLYYVWLYTHSSTHTHTYTHPTDHPQHLKAWGEISTPLFCENEHTHTHTHTTIHALWCTIRGIWQKCFLQGPSAPCACQRAPDRVQKMLHDWVNINAVVKCLCMHVCV